MSSEEAVIEKKMYIISPCKATKSKDYLSEKVVYKNIKGLFN